MATLTSTKIKNTYDALLKASDNDAIGSSAKQITDGLGNGTPLYISTTQIGIGVTPEATYDLHVYQNAKVGGNLTITGDLTVNGTTTTVDTDTLRVEDPLIEVARNNTSSDAVDIGIYGKYAPSGTTLYAGLFRDTGDDKFKLFKSLEEQPTTTVNTSGTGYAVATLVANFEGTLTGVIASTTTATTQSANDNSTKVATTAYVDTSAGNYLPLAGGTMSGNIAMGGNNISGGGTATFSSFVGDLTGNADTATALETARTIQVSGDVAGSASFDGTADINISTTIQANSVALGTDTTGNYVATISGTTNEIEVSGSGSETAAVTIGLPDDVTIGNDLTVTTDLDVGGLITVGTNNTILQNDKLIFKSTTGAAIGHNTAGTAIQFFTTNTTALDTLALTISGANATVSGNLSVSGTGSFTGQVTVPATPSASTDAASKGYVDSQVGANNELSEVLANGNTTGGTDISVSAGDDILFSDSSRAKFGDSGSDLQIYHDGNNSFIRDDGTGDFFFTSNGNGFYFQSETGENLATFLKDSTVKLYYDNAQKFQTTSSGIEVTGGATFSGNVTITTTGQGLKISTAAGQSHLQLTDSTNSKNAFVNYDNDVLKYFSDGPVEQLSISNTSATFAGDVIIPEYIKHSGDTDTSIRFTNNNIQFYTANNEVLELEDDGQVNVISAGTVTNPCLTIGDDVNTGIWRPASDTFAISTGGNERMRIDSSGNLGIGNTSPSTKLHISGGDSAIRITPTGGNDPRIDFTDSGGTVRFYSGYDVSSGNFVVTSDEGGFGSSNIMVMSDAGNVGIGTTSPDAKLDILGASSDQLRLRTAESEEYKIGRNSSTGLLEFYGTQSGYTGYVFGGVNGTRMTIDSSGNTTFAGKISSVKELINVNSDNGTRSGGFEVQDDGDLFIGTATTAGNIVLETGNTTNGLPSTGTARLTINSTGSTFAGKIGVAGKAPTYGITLAQGTGVNNKIAWTDGTPNFAASIYANSSNDSLTFATKNSSNVETTAMVIDLNQRLGIGTTAPNYKLDVDSTAAGDWITRIKNQSSTGYGLYVQSSNNAAQYLLGLHNGDGYQFIVNGAGNVGIGTTSPESGAKLDVRAGSGGKIVLGSYDANYKVVVEGGDQLNFFNGASGTTAYINYAGPADVLLSRNLFVEANSSGGTSGTVRIKSDGKVGIGPQSNGTLNNIVQVSSGVDGDGIILTGQGDNTGIGNGSYRKIGFRYDDTDESFESEIRFVVTNSGAHGGQMEFFTDNTSGTKTRAMTIDNAQNVGIGTTSPNQQLDVSGNIAVRGGYKIYFNSEVNLNRYIGASSSNDLDIAADDDINYRSNFNRFFNGSTEFARLSGSGVSWLGGGSNGYVGIGTTSPTVPLAVHGQQKWYTTSADGNELRGFFNPGGSGDGAELYIYRDDGATQGVALRGQGNSYFRVDSTSDKLINFYYGTSNVGQIVTGGTNVLYQSNSDYRLKENVVEMTGALDRVSQLKPSRYNFISHPGEQVDGFMAHELQEVVPQAVSGEKDEMNEDGTPKYQGVDHSQIVPLLVGAIKELKAEIETLKTQINK